MTFRGMTVTLTPHQTRYGVLWTWADDSGEPIMAPKAYKSLDEAKRDARRELTRTMKG